MSSKAYTTIGFERRYNHALPDSHQEFMAKAAGPLPPRPPNMETIVELMRWADDHATDIDAARIAYDAEQARQSGAEELAQRSA